MFYRKLTSFAAALFLAFAATVATPAADSTDKGNNSQQNARVLEPLNLAILIQDDLSSQVANELGVTRDFIRSLPAGSRVMVGYITAGCPQRRQPINPAFCALADSLSSSVFRTSASAYRQDRVGIRSGRHTSVHPRPFKPLS